MTAFKNIRFNQDQIKTKQYKYFIKIYNSDNYYHKVKQKYLNKCNYTFTAHT